MSKRPYRCHVCHLGFSYEERGSERGMVFLKKVTEDKTRYDIVMHASCLEGKYVKNPLKEG